MNTEMEEHLKAIFRETIFFYILIEEIFNFPYRTEETKLFF